MLNVSRCAHRNTKKYGGAAIAAHDAMRWLSIVYVVLLLIFPTSATNEAVGYISVSGACKEVLDSLGVSVVSDAVELDVISLLRNVTPTDVLAGLRVDVDEPFVSNPLTNVTRFQFNMRSNVDLSSDTVLRWSSQISTVVYERSEAVLPELTRVYVAENVNHPNCSNNSVFVVVDGACTLASPASGSDDQCGPFSCYGFAMAALLLFVLLSTAVFIYCCTRWRAGKQSPAQDDEAPPVVPVKSSTNGGNDAVDDDDPFASFDEVSPSPQRAQEKTPPAGPILTRSSLASSTDPTDRTANSVSTSVSPTRRVRIAEPYERPATPTVSLPRALSGNRLSSNTHSSIQQLPSPDPALTLAEERKRLESQPWIWNHVAK